MKTASYVIGGVAGMAVAGFVARRHRRDQKSRELNSSSEEIHQPSMTALAAESLRTGTAPRTVSAPAGPRGRSAEIPQEDDLLQVGDPNVDPLDTAMVGDEAPGGDMTTPDQDRVDDIGRAFGVSEADSGELRPTAELLAARDRRRTE
jgi:hypothetical protein